MNDMLHGSSEVKLWRCNVNLHLAFISLDNVNNRVPSNSSVLQHTIFHLKNIKLWFEWTCISSVYSFEIKSTLLREFHWYHYPLSRKLYYNNPYVLWNPFDSMPYCFEKFHSDKYCNVSELSLYPKLQLQVSNRRLDGLIGGREKTDNNLSRNREKL